MSVIILRKAGKIIVKVLGIPTASFEAMSQRGEKPTISTQKTGLIR